MDKRFILNMLLMLSGPQKISVDYDGTASTDAGKKLVKRLVAKGDNVYIITARNSKEGIVKQAKELGIPNNKVIATGSNSAKIKKIKELGIDRHIDNNPSVIEQLKKQGIKATLF